MSTQRKYNEKLYLNLQLFDGAASLPKRVFVDLRDEVGSLIKPRFEIAHVGEGEFRESSELMPNVDMVSASYFVYENDGVTLDLSYAVGKDVYMRDYSAEIIDTNLDVKVSTVSGGGSVSNIAGLELLAEVKENDIMETSVSESEDLVATIEVDEVLIGIIESEEEYVS